MNLIDLGAVRYLFSEFLKIGYLDWLFGGFGINPIDPSLDYLYYNFWKILHLDNQVFIIPWYGFAYSIC